MNIYIAVSLGGCNRVEPRIIFISLDKNEIKKDLSKIIKTNIDTFFVKTFDESTDLPMNDEPWGDYMCTQEHIMDLEGVKNFDIFHLEKDDWLKFRSDSGVCTCKHKFSSLYLITIDKTHSFNMNSLIEYLRPI